MHYDANEKILYVNSYNQIKIVSCGKIIGNINNKLFSGLHDLINSGEKSLLVVSTRFDAIVEINPKKREKSL